MAKQRSADRLHGIIRKADLTVDTQIAELQKAMAASGVTVDCKPECDFCCYRAVTATVPEVVAIAKYVRENFSSEERASLDQRLDEYSKAADPRAPEFIVRSRLACPLLMNRLCAAYPLRPLSCRGANSRDASVCQRVKENPDTQEAVPQIVAQSYVVAAVVRGLRLGLYFQAADHELVDLGTALKTVLQDENIDESYLDGKNLLLNARLNIAGDEMQNQEFVSLFLSTLQDPMLVGPGLGIERQDWEAFARHSELFGQAKFWEANRSYDLSRTAQRLWRIEVPRVYSSEEEILEWREHFERALDEFACSNFDPVTAFNALQSHQTLPLAYHGFNNKSILEKQGHLLCEGIVAHAMPEFTQPLERRKPGGKIRLGYLSANMKNSNGCRWAHGWLKNHGEDIETYALNIGPTEDFVTLRFRQDADHYFHLTRTLPDVAKFIKELQLDVLIFTDIGLNGRNLQFATMRLAPVQCTAWGHAETSGLPSIDYYLSSDLMEPANARDHYTEKLIRLPKTGLCYPRITTEVPQELTRKDFDLPEGLLYLVPHTIPTCLPRHDHIYRKINERTGRPVVFLEGPYASDTIVTKRRIANAGVNAIWVPHLSRAKFLRLLQLCDVALDTPAWSGGNTTIECLYYGKPVITWPGDLMRGRHALAFVHVAGVPGLVVHDEDAYLDLACDLDRQREAMATLNAEALFEDPEPVAALDEFLRSVAFS